MGLNQLASWIWRRRFWIRSVVSTVLVTVVLIPIALDWFNNAIEPTPERTTIIALLCASLLLATELLIARAHLLSHESKAVVYAIGQSKILKSVDAHCDILDGARQAKLLADTFKSFVDDAQNLVALKALLGRGGSLRILLMNPDGDGVNHTARARVDNGRLDSPASLRAEIRQSLRRLLHHLSQDEVCACVRLYEYPAFYAAYLIDNTAFVTIFTYGRGGSSPTLFETNATAPSELWRGLDRGFDELWTAPSTIALTKGYLEQLGD